MLPDPNKKTMGFFKWLFSGMPGNATETYKSARPHSEVKSVFISKGRGYVTPEVAALIMKKRRQRANAGNKKKVNLADNAGGTPSSVLNTQIESG